MKVLRITRHPLAPGQGEALRQAAWALLGCEDIEVQEHRETVQDAQEVLRLVEEAGASLLEAVLPIGLLAQVVGPLRERGVPVIRAVMAREVTPSGEATFTFLGYEVIERIEAVAHPITGQGP